MRDREGLVAFSYNLSFGFSSPHSLPVLSTFKFFTHPPVFPFHFHITCASFLLSPQPEVSFPPLSSFLALNSHFHINEKVGTMEVAQQLRALAAFTDDTDLDTWWPTVLAVLMSSFDLHRHHVVHKRIYRGNAYEHKNNLNSF